jgi:hypothetical protein
MATQIETLRKAIRFATPADEVRHLGFGYYAAYENGVETFRGKFEAVQEWLAAQPYRAKPQYRFAARLLYTARAHAQKYATRTDAFALRVKEAAAWLANFTREEQAKLAPRV